MTATEQQPYVIKTNEFIARWGLKKKFVAATCGIPGSTFSKFLTGKLALSCNQLSRVLEYIEDYVRRNS